MTIWRNDRAQLDTQHGSQICEHIHQWQDCCLLSDEYRPNGYSDGQGCGLGLGASVSRSPRGLPTPRLGLTSASGFNASVSASVSAHKVTRPR